MASIAPGLKSFFVKTGLLISGGALVANLFLPGCKSADSNAKNLAKVLAQKADSSSASMPSDAEFASAQKKIQYVDSLWNEARMRFPNLMKTWAEGRIAEGLEPLIPIKAVSGSSFGQIEGYGKSVIFDDFSIYINSDAELIVAEAFLAFGQALTYYGGFRSKTPFGDYTARGLMPEVFAVAFSGMPVFFSELHFANKREECLFFFATLMGSNKFIEVYAVHDAASLQSEFDKLFEPGKYDLICYSKTPMEDIRALLYEKGILRQTYSKMREFARNCNYDIDHLWTEISASESTDPLYSRARSYIELGKFKEAIADFDKLLENKDSLDSQLLLEAYANRGMVCYMIGDYTNAIENLTESIRLAEGILEPDELYLLYFERGNVYYEAGSFSQAIDDYSKSISLCPHVFNIFLRRADAYEKIIQNEKAAVDRQKAKELPYYEEYHKDQYEK